MTSSARISCAAAKTDFLIFLGLLMEIETTFTIGNIISIGTIGIAVVTAFIAMRSNVKTNNATIGSLSDELTKLSIDQSKAVKRIEEVRSKGAHELSELRIDVAKNYATVHSIEAVEKRITENVNRRFDTLDKHLQKLST